MKVIVLSFALLISAAISVAAATNTVEKVQFQGGKVLTWPGGKTLMAPDEASLPPAVVVKTNGTFTVQGGKMRTLLEGEFISQNGTLTKADGTTQPVVDHVAFQRGRAILVKDGVPAEIQSLITLGDGTTIDPDGTVSPRTSSPRRLLDGEVFQLGGSSLPARDSITLQGGQVKVQKDGSLLTVDAGRSIMMNDGTKVFGDGKVIKANGEQSQLAEGQILLIEGVYTRPR